jgi:hypothetical protein
MGILSNIAYAKKTAKLAFIDINRDINRDNLNAKINDLRRDAEFTEEIKISEILNEFKHRRFFDAITDEVIDPSEYEDYYVVLDGQHRVKAWIHEGMNLGDLDCRDVTNKVERLGIEQTIQNLNSGRPMTSVDRMRINDDNPRIKAFNNAVNAGYTPTFIAKVLSKTSILSADDLVDAINNNKYSILDVELLNKVLKAIPSEKKIGKYYQNNMFPDLIYKEKRAVINANPNATHDSALNVVLNRIMKISSQDLNKIKNARLVGDAQRALVNGYNNVINRMNP